MKRHEELRQMAAELQLRKFKEEGRNVVIQQKRDPHSPTPLRTIPVIFNVNDLDLYEIAKAKEPASPPPPPVPILDFSAWTYKPRCPNCRGANVKVEIEKGATVPTQTSRADCLRPVLGDARRDCGWSGTNKELLRPCLVCGEMAIGVEDGACLACSKKKRKRKKVTKKA